MLSFSQSREIHMEKSRQSHHLIRFGVFEVDLRAGELRKNGVKIKLQEQPFQILAMLLERPGEIVTREELQQKLWSNDTFVDFDNSLNKAINKIREALGDSADNPRFVETMARRGYRFIAPVEPVSRGVQAGSVLEPILPANTPKKTGLSRRIYLGAAAGAGLVLVIGIIVVVWWMGRRSSPAQGPVLIRLTNDAGLTKDPALSPDGKLLAFASDRSGEGNLDIWVKQIGGGEPLRLTRHEADDQSPDFSPDGSLIAFESGRDGGGVYVIPTLGGEERLLTGPGYRPRFSPDGKSIAYFTSFSYSSKSYVVPSNGGPSRQLAPDFDVAIHPIWAPDGKHLLFLGSLRLPEDTGDPERWEEDWWATSVGGSGAIRTGAYEVFRRYGLTYRSFYSSIAPDVWTRDGDRVLFDANLGDNNNVWQAAISTRTWKIEGVPRRVTFGTGLEGQASAASGDRLAFSSLLSNEDLWPVARCQQRQGDR
jgi:DNA-binding winged helix-turn-helix (wHTH) protein